mmetsp:Transcript_11263/g.43439  ORF Transcript_11263/g.43439 Transcript_11263/m.43439 type:complete len:216 (+) Transcript_11263:360-1007(+)
MPSRAGLPPAEPFSDAASTGPSAAPARASSPAAVDVALRSTRSGSRTSSAAQASRSRPVAGATGLSRAAALPRAPVRPSDHHMPQCAGVCSGRSNEQGPTHAATAVAAAEPPEPAAAAAARLQPTRRPRWHAICPSMKADTIASGVATPRRQAHTIATVSSACCHSSEGPMPGPPGTSPGAPAASSSASSAEPCPGKFARIQTWSTRLATSSDSA